MRLSSRIRTIPSAQEFHLLGELGSFADCYRRSGNSPCPEDHFRSYYNPGNRRCQEAVKKIQISVKMSGDYAPDISFFRNDYFFSDFSSVSDFADCPTAKFTPVSFGSSAENT